MINYVAKGFITQEDRAEIMTAAELLNLGFEVGCVNATTNEAAIQDRKIGIYANFSDNEAREEYDITFDIAESLVKNAMKVAIRKGIKASMKTRYGKHINAR